MYKRLISCLSTPMNNQALCLSYYELRMMSKLSSKKQAQSFIAHKKRPSSGL